jgi:hypothetical protein
MSFVLPLAVTLPAGVVIAACVVILLLGLLAGALFVRLIVMDSERYEAVAERDHLRGMVQTLEAMSRTHAETVARIASIKGKRKGGR